MANKSKFKDIQLDPCKIVEPKEKPIDRVCPTCVPNPSFIPPEWWKETGPWLNEKTCEYSVAVFVNQDGDSYQLSDLKSILEPKQTNISKSGIPKAPGVSGVVQKELGKTNNTDIKNKEKFDRIKRSYVKSGIRSLLRNYNKVETNEIVCARNDCSIFTTSEAKALVRQIKHFASLNSDLSFYEWQRNEQNIESLPKPIDNPNALELFANAADYYFYGMANGAMAVLVTIPAYIFDQIPNAPVVSEINTDVEKVRVKVSEFATWISKMESSFVLFSKFQSYFNHTEDGKLFQLVEGEEVPFYAKLMQGRFERFENSLSQFLESKGYEYYNFFSRLATYETSKTVQEIEFIFDKSDEKKPFKLADTIIIKPANCGDVTLKLPPQPNDTFLSTGDSIRAIAFRDQTLMGYIANYSKIKLQLDAQKNPPWLDFLVENTFPQISVNYGNTLDSKTNALGCLLEKFSDLDDFILNETMDFFESFSYQYNKNNCKLLKNKDKGKPIVFQDEELLKKLEKAEKVKQKRYLKKKGILEDKEVKDSKNSDDMSNGKLSELLSKISPCNWRKITLKAVSCLMSGMTLDEGYKQIIKGTIGSLTTEGMELLLEGLPADKQQKVRETIKNEFKDLPAPWEVGYEPGDIEAAYDRTAQENIDQASATGDSYEQVYEQLESTREQIKRLESTGPEYDIYLLSIQDQASKQTEDITRLELRVDAFTNSIVSATNQLNFIQVSLEDAEADYQRALDTASVQSTIDNAKQKVDRLKSEYNTTEESKEASSDALIESQQQLEQARSQIVNVLTKEQFEADHNSRLQAAKTEEQELEQKLKEALQTLREELKKDPNRVSFADMTEEQQEAIVEKEKEKLTFVRGNQADKIKQGTYGRAVGNVQKELLAAYGEAIIENASVQELIDGINKLPGATIIGELFASFDCPSYQFATPPLDEFLGTFTVGACGKGKTRPFILPSINKIPFVWSPWDSLKGAFVTAFRKSMTQVVSALILKSIQTLEAGVCQALTFASDVTQDMIAASNNGGRFPRSFSEIVADVICSDDLTDEQKKKETEKLFALMGAPKRGNTTPKEILETMSTLGSENDYLKAMIGQAEQGFLNNVSRTLSLLHPEYPELSSEEGLDAVLQSAGNYLSEEQREIASQIARSTEQFFPLDPSICLTNDQAQKYYDDLRNMYANQLGDPDLADQFVNNQRDRARGDLADTAEILSKGPEGFLQDAINDLFAQPDPDCSVDKSLLKTPEEINKQMQEITLGIFSRVQKAFLDDTVEENIAERFFSLGLGDSMGILLMITADSVGYNYAKHMRVRNQLFFRLMSAFGFFDNEAPFPETVGIQMREKLIEQNPSISDDFKYDKNNSKINLYYDNGLLGDERITSNLFIKETIKADIDGGSYHSPTFNYQFKATGENSYNFIVDNVLSSGTQQYIKKFQPTTEQLSFLTPNLPINGANTFRNYVFKNYLEDNISNITNINLSLDKTADIIAQFNNVLFGQFKESILSSEDGGISNGFLHGGSGQKLITVEDLTYVDPEPGSTEYTYNEDDAVLGRSLTNNSKIKFLDPLRHGGTYESPNIYIEPDLPFGWLSFAKLIVPSVDGCEPRGSNFLGLKELEEEINKKKNKIKRNKKLSESPECVSEIPFDKIASPSTLAILEQIVTITIRTFITEFMINSFSIHGNLAFNNNNYDELLYEYIANKMQRSLSSENSLFASTYEGYTYWLLFLEQCAQVYNRRAQLGEVPIDSEVQKAMDTINAAQIAYTKPTRDSGALFSNDLVVSKTSPPKTITEFLNTAKQQFDDTYAYPAVGGYLIAQNTRKWNKTFKPTFFATNIGDNSDNIIIMRGGLDTTFAIPTGGFRYWTQSQMNFSAKVATIAENESQCVVFLKRLIREQIKTYADKIASELEPRPPIYDINKYFIGGSKMLLGETIRSGLYDVEVPIGGESGISDATQSSSEFYGNINHCAKIDGTTALEMMNLNDFQLDKISRIGGMYLEKYVKIVPKRRESLNGLGLSVAPTPKQKAEDAAALRPNSLPSGVMNINDFINFLKTQEIPEDINISDWFGDAKVSSKTPDGYVGSIGIKFGVRICYATNKDFTSSLQFDNISDVVEKSKEQKTFLLSEGSQTAIIPLASYEKDILDEKLISLKDADDNLNQDIKCFVDGLVRSEQFDLVFNKIFNVKKVGSILACYSDSNFIASIGLGAEERKEPDLGILNFLDLGIEDVPDEDDRANSFNDTKSECRKIFVSNYKRNDFDPPSEEDGVNGMSLLTEKALAKTYAATSLDPEVSWWVRRRIKPGKPTDKEGKECQNQFGGLFNIKR